jgi:hypothetical protein
MKAWSVAVSLITPHGNALSTLFTLAESYPDAVAAGVRQAIAAASCGPNCRVTVTATHAYEIDAAVVMAAAMELSPEGRVS